MYKVTNIRCITAKDGVIFNAIYSRSKTSILWTRTGPNAPKVVFEYFRSFYDLPFKSSSPYKSWKKLLAILANLTTSGRVAEMVKRHIYGPRPFIWAYNQVSMTFRSKVLARTSSSLEKPLFFGYFGQFYNFRSGVFDRNGQKAHLRTNPFHLSL